MTPQPVVLKFTQLVDMVTQVSETLLSSSIDSCQPVAADSFMPNLSMEGHGLELTSPRGNFTLVSVSSPQDAKLLAACMAGKNPHEVTDKMVQDAACEWLNIVAGQIKSLAGIDHTMGLPYVVNLQTLSTEEPMSKLGLHMRFASPIMSFWLGFTGSASMTLDGGE